MNESCHEELIKVLVENRTKPLPLIPPPETFSKLSWRINISNGTSDMKQATVLLKFQMKTGENKTLVLPIQMFHNLRYQVASVLKNVQEVEANQKKF